MKTTIEIADHLHREARMIAKREGVTLRALVERGLHRIVQESSQPGPPFRLRKAAFGGKGLQPGAAGASWERMRKMIYEGHGG